MVGMWCFNSLLSIQEKGIKDVCAGRKIRIKWIWLTNYALLVCSYLYNQRLPLQDC